MKALPRQCEGLCRNGKRCSITATSDMRDGQGFLVAAPLLAGCARCVFHMQTFVKNHTLKDEDCVVVFMDLETSGLSTVRDRIVEIGAFSLDGVPFSTVVDPGLKSEDLAASTAVHGISAQEIMQGPCFSTAYQRFCDYVENLADMAILEDGSSDDDEPRSCHLRDPRPLVILAGHNATGFDFPFLLSECLRHSCDIGVMERWVYVDTLEMVRAIGPMIGLSCNKLQCLVAETSTRGQFPAHRAMADCQALRAVVFHMSDSLGIPAIRLLRMFSYYADIHASVINISSLPSVN